MTKKALKLNNIRVNKKKIHMSEQAIDLMSVNVNKIVVSDKFNHKKIVLNIILVPKKVKLLDHYVLFYLK